VKNRRDFIKSVAAASAVSGVVTTPGFAATHNTPASSSSTSAQPPSAQTQAMEGASPDFYTEAESGHYFVQRAGSDFMVDVIKQLNIDYMTSNPGSSFRGFQESVVAYGKNNSPEWLTCLHEESAVAMGHGYAKIAYKPLGVVCHGTVGLQHAAMAVYNAWCDRAPVIIFAGNHIDAADRRAGVEWAHSAIDVTKLVRDFIKWDDNPVSLPHFAESVNRAYKIAMTPPMGPVVITIDGHLQEKEIAGETLAIPAYSPTIPPQGDIASLREAAKLLINAEHPVILVDRVARTPEGVRNLVEFAEALQIPVVDQQGRMNFPNDHYLNQSARSGQLIQQADVILGMELFDFWGVVNQMRDLPHRAANRRAKADVKLISLGVNDLFMKSNYQNFQRYQPVDISIAGDAEATLPYFTEEVRRALPSNSRNRFRERTEALRKTHREIKERARVAATYAWDASPVSLARIYMELWAQIKDKDWSLLSRGSRWSHDLWTMNKHHQFIGYSGGAGIGYSAPAAAGAALANKAHGRFSVCIQTDGDLMYAPGILWTTAHHQIPLLSIMHNNRAYHQEVMHLQRMASRRQRGMDGLARIGNIIDEPPINYAELAKSMGLWSAGPITNPADLASIIKRAIDVVEQGEPALIDVLCQPSS